MPKSRPTLLDRTVKFSSLQAAHSIFGTTAILSLFFVVAAMGHHCLERGLVSAMGFLALAGTTSLVTIVWLQGITPDVARMLGKQQFFEKFHKRCIQQMRALKLSHWGLDTCLASYLLLNESYKQRKNFALAANIRRQLLLLAIPAAKKARMAGRPLSRATIVRSKITDLQIACMANSIISVAILGAQPNLFAWVTHTMAAEDAALAANYESHGDYRQAARYYREALMHTPSNVQLLHNLGLDYIRLHKYKRAISVFNKALNYSEQPDYYFHRAQAEARAGLLVSAQFDCKWVLRHEPNNRKAIALLSKTYDAMHHGFRRLPDIK